MQRRPIRYEYSIDDVTQQLDRGELSLSRSVSRARQQSTCKPQASHTPFKLRLLLQADN